MLKRKIFSLMFICFICIISTLLSISICNPCLANATRSMSTSLTRFMVRDEYRCVYQTICCMYLTVPQDMTTTMIVNYQYNGPSLISSTVIVSANPFYIDGELLIADGAVYYYNSKCFVVHQIKEDNRYQCWSDITGLTPGTTYFYASIVTASDFQRNVSTHHNYKFRTAPTNDSFTFVSGVGRQWNEPAISLADLATATEPLFAMIGGDIIMNDGNGNCFLDWDYWFAMWHKHMTTPLGYTIPLLTSIGEREAGTFGAPREWDSFYLHYFPHQIGLQDINPQHRPTHHAHSINNLNILALDTNVHTSISDQVDFIKSQLSTKTTKHIVLYDLPMAMPHGSHNSIEWLTSNQMKEQWLPLMTDARMVFENHESPSDYQQINKTFYFGTGVGDTALIVDTKDYCVKFLRNREIHPKIICTTP
ncbi:hypothetical protein AKO1_000165 [Acrasis kona]|uniref:Purple acid phosphatase N-terminal domain-containing protein n=1 Tax=Acrasis kona TaxID=1008807 RepID=A0AAW2ZQ64_9EUKA